MLEQGEAIEAQVAEQINQLSGVIRVSAPMSFGISSLAPILPRFMQMHPEIELDVHFDDRIVDIVAERFDLALRITKLDDSSLLARHCCSIGMLLVAAPSYIESYGSPKHPKDLVRHRILLYVYHRHGAQWHFTHPTKGHYSQALSEPVMRVNNATGMLPVLRAGLGISLLPEFLVANDLHNDTLVPVMTEWLLEPTALHIVTPPGRKRPARVNAFIAYLMKALQKQPWQKPI